MALVATQQMVLVAQRVTQAQLEIRVIQAPTVLVVLVEQQVQQVTKVLQEIQEILERMEWADQVAQLD